MLIRLGIWEVDETFGIVGKIQDDQEYEIAAHSLWDRHDFAYDEQFKNVLAYEWPIHITEKKWINKQRLTDFITVMVFAQDYFIKSKPIDAITCSWSQTMNIAYYLIEVTNELDTIDIAFATSRENENVNARKIPLMPLNSPNL